MPMKIKISAVRSPGVLSQERVVMRVQEETDVGTFVLLKAPASGEDYFGGSITNSYWFPDSLTKAGDLVILYTKKGSQSKKENVSGTTSHFFYWDQESPVWSFGKTAAVLIESADWGGMPVSEPETKTTEEDKLSD